MCAVYTQTTTFTNGTTADGGQVNTEIVALGSSVNNIVNAQIATGAGIAISKTTLGTFTDWTSYTPTWTALTVNPSLGNGSLSGAYSQIGKVIFFRISLSMGNTTTYGTGQWYFSLPVTGDVSTPYSLGTAFLRDDSTANVYSAILPIISTTTVAILTTATNAYTASSVPFTWDTSDFIRLEGFYRIS